MWKKQSKGSDDDDDDENKMETCQILEFQTVK